MKPLMIAALGLALSACATSPSAPAGTRTSAAGSAAVSAVPASGLGPQTLAVGECGLFLWNKTDVSQFIFFSRAQSGSALLNLSDRTLELRETGSGGEIFGQFMTRTAYSAQTGETVGLSFMPGEELEGGQRIDAGLLTVTDAEGWQTKLPVLGVRACQTE